METLLRELFIIALLSTVVIYACNKVKIPSIVGFLITGALFGPYALGLVNDRHTVDVLSEIGVVFLLFSIGMELSISELIRLRKPVFVGGSGQVLLTIAAFACLEYFFRGTTPGQAVFVGFLMALSSTAIVLKLFQQHAPMDSPAGRISLAILIYQDLIIVPMMLAIPLLAGTSEMDAFALAKAGGRYDPLPVDQALAYVMEILPAFSYLHTRGLLYCDFKPDNLMHVEDSVKLIDMGGVRRIDDDDSVIFGTVGFQAPEVPTQGCSVASDIYTIGRTLLICCEEVKQYQTTYATSLPPQEELAVLARFDSVYRLIAKACAPAPADRFASVEELRDQMLGVLREVAGAIRGSAATTATPSALFEPPTVITDAFTWKQLPRLRPDPADPALVMLSSLRPVSDPREHLRQLLSAPTKTLEVKLALCLAAIEAGAADVLTATIEDILTKDPWEWRAAWMEGLAALNTGAWSKAQSCFNAVMGQVPGELAPKFALAVACEMGGESAIAEQLYQICVLTDAAYAPGAAFGLARIRAKRRNPAGELADPRSVLAALDLVPTTSGGWSQSRRLAAAYLTHSGKALADLDRAMTAVRSAGAPLEERLRLELEIFRKALPLSTGATQRAARRLKVPTIGGVPATKAAVRHQIESILRQEAGLETDTAQRVRLIDEANALRKWTVL